MKKEETLRTDNKELDDEVTRMKWRLVELMREDGWDNDAVSFMKQIIFKPAPSTPGRRQIKSVWGGNGSKKE